MGQKRGVTRRSFVGTTGAVWLGSGLWACADDEGGPSGLELERDPPPPAPELASEPFRLGVASGDPLADRVVLWTRLAPEPLAPMGGMAAMERVPVVWEVFEDEGLTRPVRNGWVWALPQFAFSVHVDVDGLRPATFYWYRFRVGERWTSPTGRTKTFPAADADPEVMRFALACCQKHSSGYYTAHAHIAAADLDVVFFVGDYIYESGSAPNPPGREPIVTQRVTDLAGFRNRYAAYRTDTNLQEAHRQHPWMVTWDDHEVSNNYAGSTLSEPRRGDGDGQAIRDAGYQAWYEHMPVRLSPPVAGSSFPIYRDAAFGRLAHFYVLDSRQYRTPQGCGDRVGRGCEDIFAPDRTMLGEEQKGWLEGRLRASQARWNVLVQQVVFGPVNANYRLVNPDQWDGYVVARQRILDMFVEHEVPNPLVLSGDVHAAGFMVLRQDAEDPDSPVLGHEILATSIASGGDGADGAASLAPLAERVLPDVKYFEAGKRGFTLCELRRSHCDATYHVVTTVMAPTADLQVERVFRVSADGLQFERLA